MSHQGFELLRQSPELVRGTMLQHAKVNCDWWRVTDDEKRSTFGLNPPTGNGPGSFRLKRQGSNDVHGNFEILRSDQNRGERIFVLSRIRIFDGAKPRPHCLDREESRYVADLIETIENSCGRPNKSAIECFVTVDESRPYDAADV